MNHKGTIPLATCCLLLAAGSAASEETKILWEIGKADNHTADLALGPKGYADYGRDPIFVAGHSDPRRDWPYTHPGPDDVWAGGRPHTFTILFGLAEKIAGWPGDEDQGQMGAWFVMAAMGLFEMDGGCSVKPIYEIGSPLFTKIVVNLDRKYYAGEKLVIEARNNSKQNVYVQSATFNGEPFNKPWIYHSELVKGGTLILEMGPKPNRQWGSASEAVPPQQAE